MAPDEEGSFLDLPANETLPAASTDAQLDYAFYSLRKGVQAQVIDQKLECANIRALGDKENSDFSLRAQYFTFAWETTLYSLKCQQQVVQMATNWDAHACFKELPVWVNTDKPHQKLRFLAPGSRLLLKISQPESCITDRKVPPGYQTISGE